MKGENIMKKEVIIGKKITRGDVIKVFMVVNMYAFIMLWVMYAMVFPSIDLSFNTKIICSIILLLTIWILIVPMISATQRLEMSDESIRYYQTNGKWHQFKEILHIFVNKEAEPNFCLPLDKIKSVTLSYKTTLGGFGLKAYILVFSFLLQDNNVVTFIPFNISGGGNNNHLYFDLLEYLQEKGIEIVDCYDLKDKLKLSHQEILDYILQIEVKK